MIRLIKFIFITISLLFIFFIIKHYLYQRGMIKEKTELIGTYQHDDFVYKRNPPTTEYIHIIDTIHYVHEIFNDTLHYIDTATYFYFLEKEQLTFIDYDNVINRNGTSIIGNMMVGAYVHLPYIDMGELHTFIKIK